ncbi:hypothetical protein [Marinomonas sp. PE14-40]|uniref:hypothetical protein n=1 Tax=Marinomonas sp. PE14-40 TaxID=3060621 RepID=UPI003F671B32
MKIKQNALKVAIGFLILAALFSIWTVLLGEFGDFEIRVLLTTVSISIASMCAMACGAHIEKTQIKLAGGIGIFSSMVSLILTLLLIWLEIRDSTIWRLSLSSMVVTFALAHTLLLNLPPLIEKRFWLRYLAGLSITIMSLLILTLIWNDEMVTEGYFRLMITLAIIVALVSLLIPIFSKLDKKAEHKLESALQNSPKSKVAQKTLELKLTQIEDDIYADENGKEYRLIEL